MTIAYIAVVAGLLVLVWSVDRFVESLAVAVWYFGMPSVPIGMVVVARKCHTI